MEKLSNQERKFTNEEKIVLLCSRKTFRDEEKELLKKLLALKIDWNIMLKILIKNKVLGLAYSNIENIGLVDVIPVKINYLMKFYCYGVAERNKVIMSKQKELIQMLNSEDIKVVPLKGSRFLQNEIYGYNERFMNDIDLLTSHDKIKSIDKVMKTNGYINGNVKINSGEIYPMDRQSEIIWKTKMNNLPPYIMNLDSYWCSIIDVDFCFSLNYDMNYDIVNEMLSRAKDGVLTSQDFFIHLCCHLHKEATNATWIILENDINLIKFCDVREQIISMSEEEIIDSIEMAHKYNVQEALFYSMYFTQVVYDDLMLDCYWDKFDITNKEFLNQYGKREFRNAQQWKKPFFDRMFEGSTEELEEKDDFYNLTY